jgi:glyoxalase family protein
LHVAVRPDLAPARPGAGGVTTSRSARRTRREYRAWAERLASLRVPNSGPVDRHYFRSLYFREPDGVLFEIATDGPGLRRGRAAGGLGERLALPPFLEARRASIEAGLKPI